ncbi:MAG TPA: DUF6036 family nucleotidyltransferase [Gammaproteobacteria bacterium]
MDSIDFRILIERIAKEAGREYVLVIGAAAIVPWLARNSHSVLRRTRDIDVVLDVDEDVNDRVAFILGEGSPFDEMYGIYAQPVSFETPTYAPLHWVSRTLAFRSGGVTALCMEPHDLAISKYGAGRQKDLEFTRVLAREGHVQKETLRERLDLVECDDEMRARIRARIEADFRR